MPNLGGPFNCLMQHLMGDVLPTATTSVYRNGHWWPSAISRPLEKFVNFHEKKKKENKKEMKNSTRRPCHGWTLWNVLETLKAVGGRGEQRCRRNDKTHAEHFPFNIFPTFQKCVRGSLFQHAIHHGKIWKERTPYARALNLPLPRFWAW